MVDIVWLTLPIYLVIALGYICVKSRYIGADAIGALSRFALRICLPALIFTAIATPGNRHGIELSFVAGYATASLILLALGAIAMRTVFRQSLPLSWLFGLGMANSNSGFMGFPVASMLFGDQAATAFAMIMVIENAIVIPTAVVGAELGARAGSGLTSAIRQSLLGLVRNPLLISVLLAIVVRGLDTPLPGPLRSTLSMLAAVAPALALFVIGGTVASFPVSRHWRRCAAITFGKLVVHPLIVFAVFSLMPAMSTETRALATIFAAVPMLSILPILAAPHGGSQVSATALVAATAISFITVSLAGALLTG